MTQQKKVELAMEELLDFMDKMMTQEERINLEDERYSQLEEQCLTSGVTPTQIQAAQDLIINKRYMNSDSQWSVPRDLIPLSLQQRYV